MDINDVLLEDAGLKKFLNFLALKIDLQKSKNIIIYYGEFVTFFNSNKDVSEKWLYLEEKNIFHLEKIILTNLTDTNERLCPIKEFYYPNLTTTFKMSPAIFGFNNDDAFYISCHKEKIEALIRTDKLIKIEHIKVDEALHQLIVNHGKIFISFNEKAGRTGLDSESKAFKILFYLWDYRYETENGVEIKRKEGPSTFILLSNLKAVSGCLTNGAIRQHIKRLNRLFNNNKLPIAIESKNNKFRLVVKKS